jgi:hypothetical protein
VSRTARNAKLSRTVAGVAARATVLALGRMFVDRERARVLCADTLGEMKGLATSHAPAPSRAALRPPVHALTRRPGDPYCCAPRRASSSLCSMLGLPGLTESAVLYSSTASPYRLSSSATFPRFR